MEKINENEDETLLLEDANQDYLDDGQNIVIKPCLFVCFGHEIMEFPLSGKQLLGRPSKDQIPDIPITNKYVSRNHGTFETIDGKVTFIPFNSSNGTLLGKITLAPDEPIVLQDGDELIIPASDGSEGVDVMLVCALSQNRINIWRDLMLSAKDTLTGLPLRNTFRTWYLTNHSYKKDSKICLFLLDIDKFKRVNDSYGHDAGDKVLVFLAEQIKRCIRSSDMLIRWGGEEFVVFLVGAEMEVGLRIAEHIRHSVEHTENEVCPITISVGVSRYDGGNYRDAVRKADRALYYAKGHGRNLVVHYDDIADEDLKGYKETE